MLENLHGKTYRIETILKEEVNPNYFITKSYTRTAEVYCLGKKNEENLFQILVTGFDFSEDDNAMGKLIKQISYLFDELVLAIDKNGNIVEIDNINFLRLRWIKMVAKLSKNHKGEIVENYFIQISNLLQDKEKLIDFLGDYNMFGLLFNGLLNSSNTKRKRQSANGVTEIMTSVKDGEKMTLTISPENSNQREIDHFRGILIFKSDHYEEGFIEVKKNNTLLKHSLLWIG